jgi:hypothetical protein
VARGRRVGAVGSHDPPELARPCRLLPARRRLAVHVHRSACSALALVAARGGLEINGIKAGHADDIVVLHYDGDVVRAPQERLP